MDADFRLLLARKASDDGYEHEQQAAGVEKVFPD